jgi:hypothetical protein
MKILNLLPRLAVLCIVLIGFYCPISLADKRPIITLSVGLPYSTWVGEGKGTPAYIIKIFSNGYVEYNGLHLMDVMGKRQYQMDKKTLRVLLRKIKKKSASLSERELLFSPLTTGGIYGNVFAVRFRLGSKDTTLISYESVELRDEILKATKAEQWGDMYKFGYSIK